MMRLGGNDIPDAALSAVYWDKLHTEWGSEIGSLTLLVAPEQHASTDVRESVSWHQAVCLTVARGRSASSIQAQVAAYLKRGMSLKTSLPRSNVSGFSDFDNNGGLFTMIVRKINAIVRV